MFLAIKREHDVKVYFHTNPTWTQPHNRRVLPGKVTRLPHQHEDSSQAHSIDSKQLSLRATASSQLKVGSQLVSNPTLGGGVAPDFTGDGA